MNSRQMDSYGDSLIFRPTTLVDIPFVIDAERHPDNAPYVGQWNEARHRSAIASEDEAHLTLEVDRAANREEKPSFLGYLILMGLSDEHSVLNLRRIVIMQKGRGYGRQALRWVKTYAFETIGVHRLWFDVISSNERAKALYLSEGFTIEGTMRESWKTPCGYEDMLLLSMLKPEYESARKLGQTAI